MAPGYRNSNRRHNRLGLIDHDVFAGLPVRQWRRDFVTVAPLTSRENTVGQDDIWAVELPHGMPKDSHLLPQHSQELLRAARSGKIYKRPTSVEEEDPDPEVNPGDKPEKKEESLLDRGFIAKAWKQVPRHLEGPDVEYLAKKRKGLVNASEYFTGPSGATFTKATIKRVDAAGNEYLQDVVVPHGQQIEGEVISQIIIPDPSVTVDVYAAQPTPPKRKGPFKKKFKAPGRPRKKKLMALASVPSVASENAASANPPPDNISGAWDSNSTPATHEDIEMGEETLLNSDEGEGYDGDDVEENEEEEGPINHQGSSLKLNWRDSNVHTPLSTTHQKSYPQEPNTSMDIDDPKAQKATSENLLSTTSKVETHVVNVFPTASIENILTTVSPRAEVGLMMQRAPAHNGTKVFSVAPLEPTNSKVGAVATTWQDDREMLLDIDRYTSDGANNNAFFQSVEERGENMFAGQTQSHNTQPSLQSVRNQYRAPNPNSELTQRMLENSNDVKIHSGGLQKHPKGLEVDYFPDLID